MRLAWPAVSSVSLNRTWPNTAPVCLVFDHDCVEFDFGDHLVTILSVPRTHLRGHMFCHSGIRFRDSAHLAVFAVTSE